MIELKSAKDFVGKFNQEISNYLVSDFYKEPFSEIISEYKLLNFRT